MNPFQAAVVVSRMLTRPRLVFSRFTHLQYAGYYGTGSSHSKDSLRLHCLHLSQQKVQFHGNITKVRFSSFSGSRAANDASSKSSGEKGDQGPQTENSSTGKAEGGPANSYAATVRQIIASCLKFSADLLGPSYGLLGNFAKEIAKDLNSMITEDLQKSQHSIETANRTLEICMKTLQQMEQKVETRSHVQNQCYTATIAIDAKVADMKVLLKKVEDKVVEDSDKADATLLRILNEFKSLEGRASLALSEVYKLNGVPEKVQTLERAISKLDGSLQTSNRNAEQILNALTNPSPATASTLQSAVKNAVEDFYRGHGFVSRMQDEMIELKQTISKVLVTKIYTGLLFLVTVQVGVVTALIRTMNEVDRKTTELGNEAKKQSDKAKEEMKALETAVKTDLKTELSTQLAQLEQQYESKLEQLFKTLSLTKTNDHERAIEDTEKFEPVPLAPPLTSESPSEALLGSSYTTDDIRASPLMKVPFITFTIAVLLMAMGGAGVP